MVRLRMHGSAAGGVVNEESAIVELAPSAQWHTVVQALLQLKPSNRIGSWSVCAISDSSNKAHDDDGPRYTFYRIGIDVPLEDRLDAWFDKGIKGLTKQAADVVETDVVSIMVSQDFLLSIEGGGNGSGYAAILYAMACLRRSLLWPMWKTYDACEHPDDADIEMFNLQPLGVSHARGLGRGGITPAVVRQDEDNSMANLIGLKRTAKQTVFCNKWQLVRWVDGGDGGGGGGNGKASDQEQRTDPVFHMAITAWPALKTALDRAVFNAGSIADKRSLLPIVNLDTCALDEVYGLAFEAEDAYWKDSPYARAETDKNSKRQLDSHVSGLCQRYYQALHRGTPWAEVLQTILMMESSNRPQKEAIVERVRTEHQRLERDQRMPLEAYISDARGAPQCHPSVFRRQADIIVATRGKSLPAGEVQAFQRVALAIERLNAMDMAESAVICNDPQMGNVYSEQRKAVYAERKVRVERVLSIDWRTVTDVDAVVPDDARNPHGWSAQSQAVNALRASGVHATDQLHAAAQKIKQGYA